ncbi:branched-chain amino acid ABC transporter permease [Eoetvoesiella caeni]|uniref:Amino acid/amide ABC transporter membrane protein 2 (HAAT family) n=1 Tax=Eoetvoesiella caeni TaxID=645616 RepID=A0A366HKZ3_9BURK|nr:branched-chain amino acid ABC transporter permease [Eoetvoesiella caeni]MCI2806992.1 branched-chain amino acid ABC transporter permease [Eoetvoesiella caeni]NYT53612.1 branched-chain amino acid ABC transporter permease [Eoetvoesiella caeni]RBP43600.1 amino acid/amide ABC transporter membrane protein 2 (HAAT family) [Eoetvoesiella caeni]
MKAFTNPSVLIAILILALLPVTFSNGYIADVAIRIGLAGIVAIGLNLLMGFAGQVSIGHAAFVALGAYASGVATSHYGWPPLVALVAGAVGVAVLAYIVAKPILRLRDHTLTMATLGLGIIVNMVLINEVAWTGGPDGMAVGPLQIGDWVLGGEMAWYSVVACLLIIAIVISLNLFSSPAGRALRALHGSEVAAAVMGVNVASFKVRVFVLSAVFASIAGSLTAHYNSFITPGLAGFMPSIELATMVVIGGMASTFGVVLGACLVVGLPQVFGGFEGYEMLFFGLALMLTVIFLPKGIVPTLAQHFEKRKN